MTDTIDDTEFIAVCMSMKHFMKVRPGTELEALCKAAYEAGSLSGYVLNYDECPGCVDDRRESDLRFLDQVGMTGCPAADLDDHCQDGCPCKSTEAIADSVYDAQVVFLPTPEMV